MKILFVHKQILFPRDTGGKIRVLNLLKHLAKWHDITYVSNLRAGEEQFLPEMKALGLRLETVSGDTSMRGGARFYAGVVRNLLSSRPFTVDRNYDAAVRSKVAGLLSSEDYDLVICDTVVMAPHTIGLPSRASVLFQHNVEAQILRRHADIARGRLKKWYMQSQYDKMMQFEKDCGSCFDAVIAVSEQDRDLFRKNYGWGHVYSIDTSVDEEYFRSDRAAETPGRVVFLGSMDWMPNQDGVRWFVENVWPTVRESHSGATFHVVGRSPPAEIRGLAATPGVTIVGGVADVRPHLAQAAVVVVPLLVGGGTRLKIYEAMAMGRAVVSTTIGAEGLPVVSGTHYLAADTPAAFAGAVTKLLETAGLRTEIGRASERFVREQYGSEVVARQFDAICRRVVAARAGRSVGVGSAG